MRMDEVGLIAGDRAARRCRAPTWLSAAKRRQLSGQSAPVGIAIGTAGPVEEMRRIEHEQVEPGELDGMDRSLAALQQSAYWQHRPSFS